MKRRLAGDDAHTVEVVGHSVGGDLHRAKRRDHADHKDAACLEQTVFKGRRDADAQDAYEDETKQVELTCDQNGQQLVVTVEDHGVGIEDLEQALQPFFTTKPELERSGMGFSFMEAFMDRIEVRSKKGEGTRVVMWKYIEREREQ